MSAVLCSVPGHPVLWCLKMTGSPTTGIFLSPKLGCCSIIGVELTRWAPVVVGVHSKSNLRNACAAGPGLGEMGYRVSVLLPTENDETGRPQMEWLHRKDLSSHRDLVKRDSPAVLRPLGRDSWIKVFRALARHLSPLRGHGLASRLGTGFCGLRLKVLSPGFQGEAAQALIESASVATKIPC
jgi:hypothetical protein